MRYIGDWRWDSNIFCRKIPKKKGKMEKESVEKEMGTLLRSGRKLPERPLPVLPAKDTALRVSKAMGPMPLILERDEKEKDPELVVRPKVRDPLEPVVHVVTKVDDDRESSLIDFDDALSDDHYDDEDENLARVFSRARIEPVRTHIEDLVEKRAEEIVERKLREMTGVMGPGRYERAMAPQPYVELGMGDNVNMNANPFPQSGASSKVQGGSYMPKMKVPVYDGNSSWTDYLIQFELVAESNEWDEGTMARWLGTSLQGVARSVLGDLDKIARKSYKSIVAKLSQRFGPEDQKAMFMALLDSRVKKPDESLPSLAHEIRRLVKLSYPAAPHIVQEDLAMKHFLIAIPDPDLRMHIYKSNATTLDEAVRTAVQLEAFCDAEKHRVGMYKKAVREVSVGAKGQMLTKNMNDPNETEQGTDRLERIESALAYLLDKDGKQEMSYHKPSQGQKNRGNQERRSWQNRDKSQVTCYYCGKMGHYARTCPQAIARNHAPNTNQHHRQNGMRNQSSGN